MRGTSLADSSVAAKVARNAGRHLGDPESDRAIGCGDGSLEGGMQVLG